MTKQKLLQKLMNSQQNVQFSELVTLIEAFGFHRVRSNGSHFIYRNDNINRRLNIQNLNGKAKAYQVKELLDVITEHNLKLT